MEGDGINFLVRNRIALEMHMGVAILRVPEGLDYSGIIGDFDSKKSPAAIKGQNNLGFIPEESTIATSSEGGHSAEDGSVQHPPTNRKEKRKTLFK